MPEPIPGGLHPASSKAFMALLPDLRRSARRLSRSNEDADDLVQETLLRVWSLLAMSRAGSSDAAPVTDLRAYAFATLRSCARTRGGAAEAADTPTDTADPPKRKPETRAAPPPPKPKPKPATDAAKDALRALSDLPDDQQLLLRLRAIKGLSYAEIAAETGLPMGTVTSRLSRGRRALRQALGLPSDAVVAELLGSAHGIG